MILPGPSLLNVPVPRFTPSIRQRPLPSRFRLVVVVAVTIGDVSAWLQVAVVTACLPMASVLGGGEEG